MEQQEYKLCQHNADKIAYQVGYVKLWIFLACIKYDLYMIIIDCLGHCLMSWMNRFVLYWKGRQLY